MGTGPKGKKVISKFHDITTSALGTGVGLISGGNPLPSIVYDALLGKHVKELSVETEEYLMGVCEFEFSCPKCGNSWKTVVDLDNRYSLQEIRERKDAIIAENKKKIYGKNIKGIIDIIVTLIFVVWVFGGNYELYVIIINLLFLEGVAKPQKYVNIRISTT